MKVQRTVKRQQAKRERKKGKAYVESIGLTLDQWSQQNDPLFQIKGKERWRLTN
jgi:hypothetical protein